MKRFALSLIFVFSASGWASPVGLLPEDKKPVTVEEGERNPFGKRGPKTPNKIAEDTESEEARIRAILSGLNTVGIGESQGELTALLGSYAVKTGSELPPVIPQQSEKIRVLNIGKDNIELGFVEKDQTAETRKITILVRMKPSVRYSLGVRPPKPDIQTPTTQFGGVLKSYEEPPTEK